MRNVSYAQCYLCHSIPAISAVIQVYTFNEHLIHRHANLLAVFGVVFGVFNCYVVTTTGSVTYWFLDWQSWKSWAILATIILVFTSVFCVIATIDKKITGKQF